jgi:hypothetical protein
VRRVLAAEAARMAPDSSGTLARILSKLAEDPRHSIRVAAAMASTAD